MLKRLTTPPADLGKKSEVTRASATFDRLTGDDADLRLHQSSDGKKKYLRVWEGDTAIWYECVDAPKGDPTTTK